MSKKKKFRDLEKLQPFQHDFVIWMLAEMIAAQVIINDVDSATIIKKMGKIPDFNPIINKIVGHEGPGNWIMNLGREEN